MPCNDYQLDTVARRFSVFDNNSPFTIITIIIVCDRYASAAFRIFGGTYENYYIQQLYHQSDIADIFHTFFFFLNLPFNNILLFIMKLIFCL